MTPTPAPDLCRVLLLQSRSATQDFSKFPALLDRLHGCGRDDYLSAAFTLIDAQLNDNADTLVLLLDELGWERTVLVASTLDCPLAMEVASAFPDRVAGLFLINPLVDNWDEEDLVRFPAVPTLFVSTSAALEQQITPYSRLELYDFTADLCDNPLHSLDHLAEVLHAFCSLRTERAGV